MKYAVFVVGSGPEGEKAWVLAGFTPTKKAATEMASQYHSGTDEDDKIVYRQYQVVALDAIE